MPSSIPATAAARRQTSRLQQAAAAVVKGFTGGAADPAPSSRRATEPTTARARISATKVRREKPAGPTRERMAKGDIVCTAGGVLVAESGLDHLKRVAHKVNATKGQPLLERLHHRTSLGSDPGMNDDMFNVGKRYEELVHLAGLSGIGAQDLLAARGSGDAAHMMPVSESSARARDRLRKAWDILPDEAARAMHGLLIEGRDAESVGREASMYTQTKECRVAAITLLRIALSMLVASRWA